MSALETLFSGLGLSALFMMVVWALSVHMRDASVVDRFWGLAFIAQAAWYLGAAPVWDTHRVIVFALVVVWGLRLSAHIHLRNAGRGEDDRYKAMRAKHPETFWWRSLVTVFLLQAGIAWFVGMPLWAVLSHPQVTALGTVTVLACGLWALGFYFEAVGDWQLVAFKRDPDNRGKVLDTGLWGRSRHPNYFGDAVVWWSYFIFALAVPGGYWTVLSPIVMTIFLRYVSGVALIERSTLDRRPGYAEYVANTPAFVPRVLPLSCWPDGRM